MSTEVSWPVALAVLCLVGLTIGVQLALRTRLALDSAVSIARSLLQLAAIALIIVGAGQHLWSSTLLIVAMTIIAGVTTTGRIGAARRCLPVVIGTLIVAVAPVAVILLATGALPASGLAIIPIYGIVLGNTMASHTLGGRRALAALRDEADTYEQLLALGIRPHRAISTVIHRHLPDALVTTIDSTKTTGLVKLPGAFAGVMLGGGTPLQAAVAQVVVLAGILAATSVALGLQYVAISREHLRPKD